MGFVCRALFRVAATIYIVEQLVIWALRLRKAKQREQRPPEFGSINEEPDNRRESGEQNPESLRKRLDTLEWSLFELGVLLILLELVVVTG